jgi:hypothetical protein
LRLLRPAKGSGLWGGKATAFSPHAAEVIESRSLGRAKAVAIPIRSGPYLRWRRGRPSVPTARSKRCGDSRSFLVRLPL